MPNVTQKHQQKKPRLSQLVLRLRLIEMNSIIETFLLLLLYHHVSIRFVHALNESEMFETSLVIQAQKRFQSDKPFNWRWSLINCSVSINLVSRSTCALTNSKYCDRDE